MNETVIAKKIKGLRTSKKLSLDRLADMTGLTKGYLSRIEHSEKAPPIYTLSRISQALGVDIAQFFMENNQGPQLKDYSISRKDERIKVGGRGTGYGYDFEALALDKAGKNMEAYVVTVAYEAKAEFRHEGEELLFMLEGRLEFFLNNERFLLGEGDSIYFDAHLPHSGKSLGKRKAKMLIVIYSYRRA